MQTSASCPTSKPQWFFIAIAIWTLLYRSILPFWNWFIYSLLTSVNRQGSLINLRSRFSIHCNAKQMCGHVISRS